MAFLEAPIAMQPIWPIQQFAKVCTRPWACVWLSRVQVYTWTPLHDVVHDGLSDSPTDSLFNAAHDVEVAMPSSRYSEFYSHDLLHGFHVGDHGMKLITTRVMDISMCPRDPEGVCSS